jgi:tetratricopeptide (TPR) repeat protein
VDLARQVYKQEPTPTHLTLLKEVTFGRAHQLRESGATRDAAVVLKNALRLDATDPAWLTRIAEELARSGEVQEAVELASGLAEPAGAARIVALAADAAIEQGAAAGAHLPESIRADFEAIRTASQQVETGQDEPARETLQMIGLRSPFLEWKVFLRGLQAYYQHDDARAIENWQRLDTERVPARLAAPFRWQIDTGFRAAQPAAIQGELQRRFDRLQGSPLVAQLGGLRGALASRESLARAFRQAETLLPQLRQEAPTLVPRLASCFYWAILESGPDDLPRYRRVFGAPADDPQFHRLEALAYEGAGELTEAHQMWQRYDSDLVGLASHWPAGHAAAARALVWQRMGKNAASVPGREQEARMPAILRDHPHRPRPLKPGAVECFEKALGLAPDVRETHDELFHFLRREKKDAQAEAVARRMLERFPDHVPMLEELGILLLERQTPAEALEVLQRALHGNPLNRMLRARVLEAHMSRARELALADQYDEARPHYQAALNLREGADSGFIQYRWAACEFRAGATERAEELLAQARSSAGSPLAVSFGMLIEVARLKLLRGLKTRFDREVNEGLAAPPDPAALAFMAALLAELDRSGVKYYGQKSHTKKVMDFLKRAKGTDFTERQLERTCASLMELDSRRLARDYARFGRQRFRHAPFFPYVEACTYITEDIFGIPIWHVRPLLEEAERLAQALPREDENRDRLLKLIQDRLRALGALTPFGLLEDMFGGGPFGEDDLDDDDDEYGDSF